MLSGQYDADALTREAPDGYVKVSEGSTVVLFPPALLKGTRLTPSPPCVSSDMQEQFTSSHPSDHLSGEKMRGSKEKQVMKDEDAQAAFYNPAQVVNRDLSVCAIEVFSRNRRTEPRRRGGTMSGITILEALSATGLRAIRYFKEITNVRYIIANDVDPDAVKCIKINCSFNKVPVGCPTVNANLGLKPPVEVYGKEEAPMKMTKNASCANSIRDPSGSSVQPVASASAANDRSSPETFPVYGAVIPNLDDAVDLMHRLALSPNVHKKRLALVSSLPESNSPSEAVIEPLLQQELMDVVDLDPYGSASPFLDGALRCIKEGGMMLVTSTDSAVLCGNHMDTCHAKYNSVPYKGSHCHDMAVRILLCCVERAANKHRKYIVPLISLHLDFYIRCIFRVYTQPAETKLSVCKFGYQLQCTNCPAFWVRPMALERLSRPKKSGKRGRGIDVESENMKEEKKAFSGVKAEKQQSSEGQPVKAGGVAGGMGGIPLERFPASPCLQKSPRLTCSTLSSLECPSAVPFRDKNITTTNHSLESSACGTTHPARDEGTNDHAASKKSAMCPVCGCPVIISGPLYASPTQNKEFLTQLLGVIEERAKEGRLTATARIQGLVQTAIDELPDCPLYYNLPDIASYVRVRCPSTPCFVGALGRLGYRCSQVHCEASGIKTDCPPAVLFAVMLQWKALQDEEDQLLKEEENTQSSAGSVDEGKKSKRASFTSVPLLVSPATAADFSYDKKYDFRRESTGIAKFIPNAPGWGPKRRHTGIATCDSDP